MKKIVSEVNGYEVKFDDRKDTTNIYPYSIKFGAKPNEEFSFKTLKSAVRWAEKH